LQYLLLLLLQLAALAMPVKCILLYRTPKGTSATAADQGMLGDPHQPAACTFFQQYHCQ
jgi:hypothetical protein